MDHEHSTLRLAEPETTTVSGDLQTVLEAWRDATVEWERANELLQGEVRRLRHELDSRPRRTVPEGCAEAVGEMAVEAARQVRAKLGPTALHLHLLRRRLLGDAMAIELLQRVESGLAMLDEVTDDLLQFAAAGEPELQPVGLREVVQEVHDSLSMRMESAGVATTVDVPRQVTVIGDRALLRRAIEKLTLCALEAMPGGGEIVVTSFDGPRGIELEVADSGERITDVLRRETFQPCYGAQGSSGGLGLAVVERIAQLHGGDVTAANCPEGGAAFTLRFPPRHALRAAA